MTATRPGVTPFRFTREQYYHLHNLDFFDGKRVERLRGEIIEMSGVNWPHVVASRKTAILLEKLFSSTAWVNRCEQPIPTEDSDPQPDVMVIPGRFEDYNDHPTTALLIVEVSDSTLFKDTTLKAEIYATAGVQDYWVIDGENRQLHVFRDPVPLPQELGATAYQSHVTLGETDSVAPLAMSNQSIRVAEMLP